MTGMDVTIISTETIYFCETTIKPAEQVENRKGGGGGGVASLHKISLIIQVQE